MITVGCSGFAVPATRYFKEYSFVEVGDVHGATPGSGSVRRWRREAPEGFRFAVLGTKDIGAEGFRDGKVVESALKIASDVAADLSAQIAVFIAPSELAPTKANKTAVRDFLERVRSQFGRVVWEPPVAWTPKDADAVVLGTGAVAARDPLAHGLSSAPTGYYRLAGPAGHKSRYEDPAIEKLAELARVAAHDESFYIFTNVDMFSDGKRLKKLLKLK